MTDQQGHKPNTLVTFTAPADDADTHYGTFTVNDGKTVTTITDSQGRANAGVFTGKGAYTKLPHTPVLSFALHAGVPGTTATAVFDMQYTLPPND